MSIETDNAVEVAADAFYDALMDRFMQRIQLYVSIPQTIDDRTTLHFMLLDSKTNDIVASEVVTFRLVDGTRGGTRPKLQAVRGY